MQHSKMKARVGGNWRLQTSLLVCILRAGKQVTRRTEEADVQLEDLISRFILGWGNVWLGKHFTCLWTRGEIY